MNKVSKHVRVLLCITFAVVVFTVAIQYVSSNSKTIFLEKVSFGEFYVLYNEAFEITQDTELRITLKSEIKEGSVNLRIYSEDGEICFENSGKHLDESVIVPIKKGLWYFIFSCNGGDENIGAIDGHYEVCIELAE